MLLWLPKERRTSDIRGQSGETLSIFIPVGFAILGSNRADGDEGGVETLRSRRPLFLQVSFEISERYSEIF